jgi:hypothetical protein
MYLQNVLRAKVMAGCMAKKRSVSISRPVYQEGMQLSMSGKGNAGERGGPAGRPDHPDRRRRT